MRSVPRGSFERLTAYGSLWGAWERCRRRKRRQAAMAEFDLTADRTLLDLHRALRAGQYEPSRYRLQVVHDPKTRLVAAPAIIDRVVQTALLLDIGPTYERGFIDQSYACGTGRGPHRAVLAFLASMRRYQFRLSLDIRRYFASVRHETLLGLFAHRLRDESTVELLRALVGAGGAVYATPVAREVLRLDEDPLPAGCGLPLGGYLSHWSGGLYLDGLDHYAKRTLKVQAYQRYMDDISVFSDDALALEEIRAAIAAWLASERGLTLKHPDAPAHSTAEATTYLGMRVSRAGVAPGPKAKRRLKLRLRNGADGNVSKLMRGLEAYHGLVTSVG